MRVFRAATPRLRKSLPEGAGRPVKVSKCRSLASAHPAHPGIPAESRPATTPPTSALRGPSTDSSRRTPPFGQRASPHPRCTPPPSGPPPDSTSGRAPVNRCRHRAHRVDLISFLAAPKPLTITLPRLAITFGSFLPNRPPFLTSHRPPVRGEPTGSPRTVVSNHKADSTQASETVAGPPFVVSRSGVRGRPC